MRVLFLTAWYPTPDAPTAGIFVREHARAVALHHDVTVLHIVHVPDQETRGWRIVEERDPQLTMGIRTLRVVRGPRFSAYPFKVYAAVKAARALQPDLIHAHVYEAGVPAVLVGKRMGIPVLVTEQWSGFPLNLLGWRQRLQAHFTFRLADCVLPVSAALAAALRRYVGRSVPVEIIPNTVDVDLFYPAERSHVETGCARLLFAGLLDPNDVKNLPLLLRALRRLADSGASLHLDVAGDGPSYQRCKELALQLDLQQCVRFYGLQPKLELARLMRRADVFVLPSRWDNMPCVVVEALACGTPVVATRVGGIPEIVSDTNGILVPSDDLDALVRGLTSALARLEQFDRNAIASDAHARYSLQAIGARFDAAYADVFARRRGRIPSPVVSS